VEIRAEHGASVEARLMGRDRDRLGHDGGGGVEVGFLVDDDGVDFDDARV